MRALRTGLGFRVAMMIATFAALCLPLPPAVMAFGHGSHLVHCLTHGDAVDHGLYGGGGHKDHSDGAKVPVGHATNCCGLFLLSALAPSLGPIVNGVPLPAVLSLPAGPRLLWRVPNQPDRPPIPSLSV